MQLKQFGANIFVADLVGLAVCRELGPLMTAIILCGRSGAAFAAELGSMKVAEEIDALRTMGFGPMRFLVMPRMVAQDFAPRGYARQVLKDLELLMEAGRERMLAVAVGGQPLVRSRYVRTVWLTLLVLVIVGVQTVMNAPAADIVYKEF